MSVSETEVQYAWAAEASHTHVYTCLLTKKRPCSTRHHRNTVTPRLVQQRPKPAQVLVYSNSMAALTGLLGDYGSDDDSDNHETGTQEVEMAEAGEAASRSASAMLSTVDGAPQVSTEELLTETDMASLPQQPAEFDLPPEIAEQPDQVCSAAVQAKIVKLLGIQSKGRFLNAELRSSRPYRNPDFLSHTVKHFELDPHGTCYPSDVFDPNALHKEDYYDRLAAEFNAWRERKSHQQQQKQQVDFVKGGTERAPSGPGGLQNKAQQTAAQVQAQAKAQAVLNAAQHKGGRNKWDTGPGR